MGLSIQEYNDIDALVQKVSEPLEAVAGSLAEIRANLESIVANGATVTISIKVGGDPSE